MSEPWPHTRRAINHHFYRQAGAFDTLLQMARWFGYRDGYEDLTRIWIDLLVVNHFRRGCWRTCAATLNR